MVIFFPLLTCRYMNRLAKHAVIRKDDILRDFLENPSEVNEYYTYHCLYLYIHDMCVVS